MVPACKNMFSNIPEQLPEELIESILDGGRVRIERIVSRGHVTTPGQWYDQEWDEWVLLLQGHATLLYESDREFLSMKAGDYLLIPAHTRHRVEWTQPDEDTIWLAVYLESSNKD